MAVKSFSTVTLTRLVNNCKSVSSALSNRISSLESSAALSTFAPLPNGVIPKPPTNLQSDEYDSFFDYIKSIDSSLLSMQNMFKACSHLTSADFTDCNFSNVTNIQSMFFNCTNLTSVDFSGCDLSNVTSASSMFYKCTNLTSVDFSGCDLSKVTGTSDMFYYCTSLTSLKWGGAISAKTVGSTILSLNLAYTKLTPSAANAFFNSLSAKTISGTATIKMPSTASGADTSIATGKGYTITGI